MGNLCLVMEIIHIANHVLKIVKNVKIPCDVQNVYRIAIELIIVCVKLVFIIIQIIPIVYIIV